MHYYFLKYPIAKKLNKLDAAVLNNATGIQEICSEA